MSSSFFSNQRDSSVNNQLVENNLVTRENLISKKITANDLTVYNSLIFPNAVTEVGDVLVAVDTNGTLAWASSESLSVSGGGTIDGSGTANVLSKWSDADTLADSNITDSGTIVTLGVHTNLPDSQQLRLGTGNDLTLDHNGTDSIITSTTGDLIVDNTNTGGSTVLRLGTDTVDTAMEVRNDTNDPLFTVSGEGSVSLPDDIPLRLGTGNDLSLVHNNIDSNSVVTSTTGDLIVDNTNTGGSTVLRLGTDTSATAMEVRNDSDTTLFKVDGAGNIFFGTENVFIQATSLTTAVTANVRHGVIETVPLNSSVGDSIGLQTSAEIFVSNTFATPTSHILVNIVGHEYLDTDGKDGLPVVSVQRQSVDGFLIVIVNAHHTNIIGSANGTGRLHIAFWVLS